jgi:hypothetical protein
MVPTFRTPPPARTPPRDRERDTTRPVVRMGTIIDDLESPSWQRPGASAEPENGNGKRERTEDFTMIEEPEDQFDIPAFLRKHAG